MKESKVIRIGKRNNFKIEIYLKWGFTIKYLTRGYNDYNYPQLIWHLFFGEFFITFPWKHNIEKDYGHDDPSYGITYHNKSIMVYWNRKCHVYNLPFFSYNWVRTSLFLSDGTWEHEIKENRKNFYEKEWTDKQWQIIIPYVHRTSEEGDIDLLITCHITEREWRRKWFKWTKMSARIKRTVDVEFSEEVGPRRGSWKGGVLGTGFDITKTGDINEGLKTMEKEYDMYSVAWDRQQKIKQISSKFLIFFILRYGLFGSSF